MPTCQKCLRRTIKCRVCLGKGRVPYAYGDCIECGGTGWVCPEDGKQWRQ